MRCEEMSWFGEYDSTVPDKPVEYIRRCDSCSREAVDLELTIDDDGGWQVCNECKEEEQQ